MNDEQVNHYIQQAYYIDKKKLEVIVIELNALGIKIDKAEVFYRVGKPPKELKPTGRYAEKISITLILENLKHGETIEHIKQAAQELGRRVDKEDVIEALKQYEDWKETHPSKTKTHYKRGSKEEKGEEGR